MNRYLNIFETKRETIQRIVFGCILLVFAYRFYSNGFLHQFGQPPLIYAYIDFTYWIFSYLGIPQLITSSTWITVVFDIVFIGSVFGSILKPDKTLFPWLFVCFSFVDYITINFYSGHHYHGIGMLFVGLPFLFSSSARGALVMACVRYYFLAVFVWSFVWKLLRGNFLDPFTYAEILKQQNLEFIYLNLGHFKTGLYFYLIEHYKLSQMLWISMMLIQLCFVIGFFTYKYDRLLVLLYIVFAVGSSVLMNITTFETTIFLVVFIPRLMGNYLERKSLVI